MKNVGMQRGDLWNEDQKYRQLFVDNPMPMWIYDTETKAFLEVNDQAVRRYGYTREEFLGMTIYDIRPPEDIPQLNNVTRIQTANSSIYQGNWRHYLKSGELVHVEVTSHLIEFEGRSAMLVMVNDITEKIKAEELRDFELRDKEALINNTHDMIWSVSPEMQLVAANKAFLDIMRHFTGKDLRRGDDLLMPQYSEQVRENWRRIYSKVLSGQPHSEEAYAMASDGGPESWLDIRCNPIYDGARIVGVACHARDITDRKQYEEALKDSNERYNLVSKATSDIVWDFNLETGEVYRNAEGWNKVFGDDGPTLSFNLENELHERVHPDDRLKLVLLMQDIEKSPDTNFFEVEFRVQRNDGTYADIVDRGYVLRNEKGMPVRLIGATQDITEKKAAQDKLRLAEERKQLEITEAVISAQENERQEIGRELHDNINQILASARLYLGMVQEIKSDDISFSAKADELLDTAITEIRALSHALIPPTLGKTKLTEALSLILDTVAKTRRLTIQKEFASFRDSSLSEKMKLTIYRITQEQINNILKHSGARTVWVKLENNGDRIKLIIEDDGVGFDPTKRRGGVGLMNIRTRASLLRGRTKIVSSPGSGCRLAVTFPAENGT